MGFITENAAMLNQSWSILKAVLDFSLIFLLVYVILYFLRGTRAVYILVGIVIFLIAAIILIQYMQLEVLGWLLQNLWPVLATAVVIVFQPELRRMLRTSPVASLVNSQGTHTPLMPLHKRVIPTPK